MPTAYLSPSQLKELTDVSVNPGSGQNGYPLVWNNTTSKWEASLLPYASISNSPVVIYPTPRNGLSVGSTAGSQVNASSTDFLGIGPGAGQSNTSGNFVAIGGGAGRSNISGTSWVAIGLYAAANDTNSSNFLALGEGAALSHNAQGNNFFAFGSYSAFLNQSGDGFVAIGTGAGFNNTIGSTWFALGVGAAQINKTGGNFLVLGNNANNNGGVGRNDAGSNYICIGNFSGYYETRSNTLHIANTEHKSLIFGNFADNCVLFGSSVTITSDSATWPVATAAVHCAPSSTARASLRIESGTAPTTPNVGDMWITGGKLYIKGVDEIVFVP